MILTTVETTGNLLKTALDNVLTHQTPPANLKYMEMQSAIGNPPWKKKGKELENIKNSLSLLNPLERTRQRPKGA